MILEGRDIFEKSIVPWLCLDSIGLEHNRMEGRRLQEYRASDWLPGGQEVSKVVFLPDDNAGTRMDEKVWADF